MSAGFAFGTMRFRGRSVLFYLLLLGLLIPLEAMIIPLYFDLRRFGLTGNYWSVILPDSALSTAFGCFWMRAFFLSAPRSLVEAARLDGATVLTRLRRVLLPLARPQVLTLAVLAAWCSSRASTRPTTPTWPPPPSSPPCRWSRSTCCSSGRLCGACWPGP